MSKSTGSRTSGTAGFAISILSDVSPMNESYASGVSMLARHYFPVPARLHMNPIVTTWLIKVGWETLATPLTYAVVGYLKRTEGVDVYDFGRPAPARV